MVPGIDQGFDQACVSGFTAAIVPIDNSHARGREAETLSFYEGVYSAEVGYRREADLLDYGGFQLDALCLTIGGVVGAG